MKKFLTGLLSLAVMFSIIPAVNAENATMTVKREAVMESYIGDNNGFTSYVTTDGTIVYCMDLDKPGATTGTGYKYITNGDAGLLYLMENGYPNKKITNRNEIDRYITQSAVWWYLSDIGQTAKMNVAFQTTDREAYKGIRDEIKKLVAGAKNAKAQASSIKIQNSKTSLSLTSDEKYYESSVMSVNLSGAQTYTITVSGGTKGTIVTDENGSAKSEFKANEKFKIRIPSNELTASANIVVKASAQGGKAAAVYAPNDSSFQRVVSTKITTKTMEDAITLAVSPSESTPGVEISVPNTAANIPFIILGVGIVLIAAGIGVFWYADKKKKANAK